MTQSRIQTVMGAITANAVITLYRRALKVRAIRHAIASALMLALLTPFGTAALLQGRAVSIAIMLSEQENFSAYGSASSEARR